MPSPIRLIRRWTRKKPTAGASTPTTAPVANASRMNSDSSMDVRGVVPDPWELAGRPVEDEQLRVGGEGLRDEGALLLPAGEALQGAVGDVGEADPPDRLGHAFA